MSRSMSRPAQCAAAVLFASLATAGERPAALAACEAAALDEMQSRHPDAVDVQALEDQVSVTDTAGGQVEVTGGGQIAQDVGTWTPFGYTCSFSPTSGQVTRVEIR